MTVNREKNHTFVGMDIIFTKKKTVQITMNGHIRECFEAFNTFDEEITKEDNTPTKSKLFEIDKNSMQLSENK